MAIDYSEWKTKRMRVSNLFLDPLNPRIPGASDDLAQHEIIADLIKNDDVFGLAKSIATNGFFPTDSLVAVFEGSEERYRVVEGNRRLAALKVLLSPQAAPETEQTRFRRLAATVEKRSLTYVRVSIAPSREDTIPLIVDRHTQTQVERWSPAMQARFFRHMADSNHSVEEISEISGVPISKVREALRNDALYRVACSLELNDEVAAKVRNPRKFPLSTLERILEYKVAQDFFGIKAHPEKIFVGATSEEEFTKGFGRLVGDIATGKVDSRSANREDAVEEYLGTFGADAPNLKKKGTFSIRDLGRAPQASKREPSEPKKSKGVPRESGTMIPTGLRCKVSSTRIKGVFNELKRLKLKTYPNACAVLTRTLLDLGVTHYLEKTGQMPAVLKRFNKKGQKPVDWSPTLRQQLTYLLEDTPPSELQGQRLSALRRFAKGKQEELCLDTLDKFTHNKYEPADEKALLRIRTTIEPLMQILLVEPS